MDEQAAYRVLARKHRPQDFDALIGQEAMVQVLRNAFAQNRIAHAFVLTGVRGVGKTTTARIIARALNCIGPDGQGGPTVTPCGVCPNCQAILTERHVDVMEMDAASNTSVNDVRELIEGARYRPVQGRYKVYIIDEAHMLSNSAFNALLKTLEEPPPHVKFLFATTEVRKLPVTVLSRCQRFDLRRVPAEKLKAHFARIAGEEGAKIEDDALAMIARAADGSVRDGLSLLDQLIALAGEGSANGDLCREMLGLADRAATFALLEALFAGDAGGALDLFAAAADTGVDPAAALQDLMDCCHLAARAKAAPKTLADPALPELERERGGALAERLSQPVLARMWKLLLKGHGETLIAPNARQAAEMALIRCAFASDLPDPAALARTVLDGAAPLAPAPKSGGSGGDGGPAMRLVASGGAPARAQPAPAPEPAAVAAPADFRALAEMLAEKGEVILYAHLRNDVRPVRVADGVLELDPGPAPASLLGDLRRALDEWTGRRWAVAAVAAPDGVKTLAEIAEAEKTAEIDRLRAIPFVARVFELFPDGGDILFDAPTAPPPTAVTVEPPEEVEIAFEPAIEPPEHDEDEIDPLLYGLDDSDDDDDED